MSATTREYRDRLFTFIFGSKEHRDWTLSLYNAINGTDHRDPDSITINTVENVIYMGSHNDVSFLIADTMNMYEQQSTYNPNMPLRMLQYASSLFEKHVSLANRSKYASKRIPLPTPKIVTFFNGTRETDDVTELLLSDSFAGGVEGDIEVRVRMVNVNEGRNQKLMAACKPMREYAWTIERIRESIKGVELKSARLGAINEVIERMPDDFEIKPYLAAHKAEVVDMLLTEYDEAKEMELLRLEYMREGLEEGREKGREEGREEALIKSIANLAASLPCSFERAMELLGIPEADRNRYLTKLQPAETEA